MMYFNSLVILTCFAVPVFAYETNPHPYNYGYRIVTCDDGQRFVISGTFRFHSKARDKCSEFQQNPLLLSKQTFGVNEALAYCWKNHSRQWLCDGRIQRTQNSHYRLQVQLNAVGCDRPRKQSQIPGGTLFYCGYLLDNKVSKSKASWNRDIRQWHYID